MHMCSNFWCTLHQASVILWYPYCRFADNPLVTSEPHIRFYAGAPLVSSTGHRLGSLCIIDRKPRTLDAESCNVLCNFAEVIIRELEKDRLRVRAAFPAVLDHLLHMRLRAAGLVRVLVY